MTLEQLKRKHAAVLSRTPADECARLRTRVVALNERAQALRRQGEQGGRVAHKLIPVCEQRAVALRCAAQLAVNL